MNLRSIISTTLLALTVSGLAACAPRYESIDVVRRGGAEGAYGSGSEFELPEGGVLLFAAAPITDDSRPDYEDGEGELKLFIADPEVAQLIDGRHEGEWLMMGLAAGETELDVVIDDELQERIPVFIVEQMED